jgi:hypothetical protein
LEKQPEPTIYASYEQMPDKAMVLTVRTTIETQAMVKAVKQAVWSVDPGQPVFQIRSMDEYVLLATTAPRVSTVLLAVFAGISMLLAALGIHGVVSYGVAQRIREFGLRMALGSTPRQLAGTRRREWYQDRADGSAGWNGRRRCASVGPARIALRRSTARPYRDGWSRRVAP